MLTTAVILAAGLGRRLGQRTEDRPKAMLDVGGESLLERLLRALKMTSLSEVVVVTGHHAEQVQSFVESRDLGIRVRTLFNPRYAVANNIVSFLAAEAEIRHGCLLFNSDIIVDPSVVAEVAAIDAGNWLVVDHDEPLGPEEMKIQLDGRGVIRRISKELPPAECAGEYIGAARFDALGAAACLRAAAALVEGGGTNLYYEHAIDASAAQLQASPLPTRGRLWTEIDDLADYDRALQIVRMWGGDTPS